MTKKLNILILEDNESDADLLHYELKRSELDFVPEIVQNRESFEKALYGFKPDIILSDYNLPGFNGIAAFHLKQKIAPHIPFIIVSGVIGFVTETTCAYSQNFGNIDNRVF